MENLDVDINYKTWENLNIVFGQAIPLIICIFGLYIILLRKKETKVMKKVDETVTDNSVFFESPKVTPDEDFSFPFEAKLRNLIW